MAGPAAGRQTSMTWKGSSLTGARTRGVALNGNPIDITSGENSGRRLLYAAAAAQDEINISIAGIAKDLVLRNDWFTGGATRQGTLAVTWLDGSVLSGTFQLVSYTEAHPYNDAVSYQAELQSSGDWTYTPGA